MRTSIDYQRVRETPEERAEWRAKKGPNHAPPYRVQCRCGKRYWLSGLAVGSHRRSCPGPKGKPGGVG